MKFSAKMSMGLLLLFGILGPATASAQENLQVASDGKSDPTFADRVAGVYRYQSGSSAGRPIPKSQLNGRVIVSDDRILVYDADGGEIYVIQWKVVNDASPYQVDLTTIRSTLPTGSNTDATAKGLMELDGSTLRLLYDYQADGYPQDFETKAETENRFVLTETVNSQLIGTYMVTEGESANQPLPERALGGTVAITPGLITLRDPQDQTQWIFGYRLLSPNEPYRVRMTILQGPQPGFEGQTARGLLGLNEDGSLSLIYSYGPGQFPTDFEADLNNENFFILKEKIQAR